MSILKLAYSNREAMDRINDAAGDLSNYEWAVTEGNLPYNPATHRGLLKRELMLEAANPQATKTIARRAGGATGAILGGIGGAIVGGKTRGPKGAAIGAGAGALSAGLLGYILGNRGGAKVSRRAESQLADMKTTALSRRNKLLAARNIVARDREEWDKDRKYRNQRQLAATGSATALGVASQLRK